jgi:Zn-dependent protease with chaperone function
LFLLFSQIISFILIMVVWEAYRPSAPELALWETVVACFCSLLLLWVVARLRVLMVLGRVSGPRPVADPAKLGRRAITELHALAVAVLALMIVLLDLKAHVMGSRLIASSETLSGLCAVILYFALLSLVWSVTYPLESQLFHQGLSQRQFVLGQARFVAPVVFPWLAIVIFRDLLQLLWPGARDWLDSGPGDLFFLASFVALMAVFFPWMVRHWWGCRNWPEGPVRDLAERVLELAKVKVGAILSWPIMQGRLLTAGILGVAPRFRYLLITPSLVEAMTPAELAAVVAHEAGHVRHRHLVSYLLFFLGFFVLAYALAGPIAIGFNLLLLWLSGTGWGAALFSKDSPGGALFSLLMALPLVALLVVYLRFVMGYFMRNFERQADLYALKLMGSAGPLSSALEKLAQLAGNTRDVPSWHHFSVAQRVDFIHRADEKPGLIKSHAGGLRKALAWYLTALICVSALGFTTDSLGWGESIHRQLVVQALEQRLAANPHNPDFNMALGILAMEDGNEPKAFAYLSSAAKLDPRNPETLNSLAWLLATAKNPAYRRPRESLLLALEAVKRAPRPHIWDTLAEAYFVNGEYDNALAAARAALQAKPKDRLDYYQEQLTRFEKAAKGEW